uniref:NADH-ubiquinone oxidoreductase chain 5 n=1 Tax=Oreohelix idahoensis TaxID=2584915 RepID=A0A4Y5P335_9EUPU|nr:NADH dehydrogenase subunit 5 [Oreohelix idahoensis]QCW57647.1 NADH dehydrogenase subunit 5 [Oreohelix idahoensis]UKG20810.1 NADH dehydrogenase subunit 5 [Oreohelix idahoensis]
MRWPLLIIFMSLPPLLYYFSNLIMSDFFMINLHLYKWSTIYLSYTVLFDKISLSFSFVVLFISACVFSFALTYMKEDEFFNRFMWILFSFVLSMNLLIYAGSFISIMLGWDGLGLTSFALIIYYQSKDSLTAGYLTLLINRIGDILIMLSFVIMVYEGNLMMYSISNLNSNLMLLMGTAALTKSAQFPFSPWLPAAMAAPTPVSALVHSSTLVTAGIYLLIRLSYNVSLSSELKSLLLLTGSFTSLLGALAAISENDLKKIIALSTLSQLGVMVYSLGLNSPEYSLFHLYSHAMFKALLFLIAGLIIMSSFGLQDMRMLGGVMLVNPQLSIFFFYSLLCLVGLPFFSGFYSKHSIMLLGPHNSTMNLMSWLMIMVGALCTSLYNIRMVKILVISPIMMHTNILKINQIYLYLPLIGLALMAALLGKCYYYLDPSNWICLSLSPMFISSVVNYMFFMGLIMSLLLMSLTFKSHFFCSLSFSSSFFLSILLPFSMYYKEVSKLDMGWVEPSNLFSNSLFHPFLLMNKKMIWPY